MLKNISIVEGKKYKRGIVGVGGYTVVEIYLDHENKYVSIEKKNYTSLDVDKATKEKIEKEATGEKNNLGVEIKKNKVYQTAEVCEGVEGLIGYVDVDGVVLEVKTNKDTLEIKRAETLPNKINNYQDYIGEIQSDLREGRYTYKNETKEEEKQLRSIRDGHIYDENKSIKWNREKYKEDKERLKFLQEEKYRKESELRGEYWERLQRYVISETGITRKKALEILNTVSCEFDSIYSTDGLKDLEVILDLINSISI